jgi:hypothetical protein
VYGCKVRERAYAGAMAKAYTSAVASSSKSCNAAHPIVAPLRSITTKLPISDSNVCRACRSHQRTKLIIFSNDVDVGQQQEEGGR